MRTLTTAAMSAFTAQVRQPRYQVLLWDLFTSGAPSLSTIVTGSALSTASAYALDITSNVIDPISLDEPGDKRAAKVSFQLMTHTGAFDPTSGANAAWIRENQVVQLKEGDATLSAGDYVTTFTGHIRGQVGYTLDREAIEKSTAVTAYGRRATPAFLKRTFTSKTYGRLVDYGTIVQDIAIDQMQLGANELARMPRLLGKVTQFATNSIVELAPLEAIDKILETVGLAVDFDGEGRLRTYDRNLRRSPEITYTTLDLISRVSIPASEHEGYNSVRVVGLDSTVTVTEQPEAAMARATIPVGFWRPVHTVEVRWSADDSVRCATTALAIQTSVNDHLLVRVGTERYRQQDEISGILSVTILAYVAALLVLIIICAIIEFAIPDISLPFGGPTIPVGKIASGLTLSFILFTISINSSGTYEIRGLPKLPVFKEIAVVMTKEGTLDYLLNEKELKNDWLNHQPALAEIALLELVFEHSLAFPREFSIVNDLRLEVGDLVELPIGNGMRVWVESFRKQLSRDRVPILDVSGSLAPRI